MRQLVAVLLLASLLPGCSNSPPTLRGVLESSPAADPTPANREDDVRKELAANYANIIEGFKNNDPSVWLGYLTPDFHLKLFNGQVQDRKWVTDYVRNNAKTFRVETLSMRITGLTIEGDDATAVVEQLSSRTFTDEKQQPHRLDVGAVQREMWTRTTEGLRLKFVEEKEVLYLKQDGKPLRQ
jgi:hypothetical protein